MKPLQRILRAGRHLLLYALLALYLSPFFFVLINSFKSRRDIVSNPFAFPEVWSLQTINAFRGWALYLLL